jgi:hypothetical protein
MAPPEVMPFAFRMRTGLPRRGFHALLSMADERRQRPFYASAKSSRVGKGERATQLRTRWRLLSRVGEGLLSNGHRFGLSFSRES